MQIYKCQWFSKMILTFHAEGKMLKLLTLEPFQIIHSLHCSNLRAEGPHTAYSLQGFPLSKTF